MMEHSAEPAAGVLSRSSFSFSNQVASITAMMRRVGTR
jgi:hypothetical protein